MYGKLKRIWNPEFYHGDGMKNNFFEGWYFKSVSDKHDNILAIIPGIFIDKNKIKSHAFIQFLDGKTGKSHFLNFKISEFSYNSNNFDIGIGDSKFSLNGIEINIKRKGFEAYGSLTFKKIVPWPISFLSPGAMGWYSFVPFMQCNHGVLSFNHSVTGKVLINNELFIFTKDKGYIEKDWGKSFPSSYVWMQSNSFANPTVSLCLSVAKIPWLLSSFTGYLGALFVEDKLYRFTTYTGAKIREFTIDESVIKLMLEDKNYILEVVSKRSHGGELLAPDSKEMGRRIVESLNSEIKIKLTKKIRNNLRVILEDIGRNAGLEIVGNVKELI